MSAPESRELIYYRDRGCKKPYPFVGEGMTRQRIVSSRAVRQGKSGTQKIYLKNRSSYEYQIIQFLISNRTLDVRVNKSVIPSGGVAVVTLVWSIPKNQEVPFEAPFVMEGNFIVGGKK